MEIKELQQKIKLSSESSNNPFRNASEIVLAATEELGEVAQEVALLEKIGSKATWQKEPSKERLAGEISNLLNCIVGLANHYEINIEDQYK